MAPATHRAVRSANNLLTATPDEAAIIIACAITDPRDLLALAVACRRFFIKVARRWIAACTDRECCLVGTLRLVQSQVKFHLQSVFIVLYLALSTLRLILVHSCFNVQQWSAPTPLSLRAITRH
eukprot:COSAG06_NODE_1435_length_9470_cov_31.749653_14_plen_124_part_00